MILSADYALMFRFPAENDYHEDEINRLKMKNDFRTRCIVYTVYSIYGIE